MPLGILVIKSDFFPRLLGILLIIGCVGHIISSFTVFIPVGLGAFASQIGNTLSIGELPFFLWLIIFGARNLVIRRKASMETR